MRHRPSSHTPARQVRNGLESERIRIGGSYRLGVRLIGCEEMIVREWDECGVEEDGQG